MGGSTRVDTELREQAVERNIIGNACEVSELEGDEGDAATYSIFEPDEEAVTDKIRRLIVGSYCHDRYQAGDIAEIENLYRDEENGLEVGSGSRTVVGKPYTSIGSVETRVVYEGETVFLSTDTINWEDGSPVRVYKPGDWEDDLDSLAEGID